MGWRIVERRIDRAGGLKRRMARQREWDQKYGEGMWETGYIIEGNFMTQEQAFEPIYVESYRVYFQDHPDSLNELCSLAKKLRNPHAAATTSVDLQTPAIHICLEEHAKVLSGKEIVDIGTWQGQRSHPISERLSPLHIPCAIEPKMSLEKFWQAKKCLAVWEEPNR